MSNHRHAVIKHKPLPLILFAVMALSVSLVQGQGSLGPIPKKARTPEDYEPSTLKEIAAPAPKRDELLPFRVRVGHTASVRPISRTSNGVLQRWAQCCAGNPDHYTRTYLNEMRFVENGAAYWLPVQERVIGELQTEVKIGEELDLFLIRLTIRGTNRKGGSVLLVERFQKATSDGDGKRELVDWIRINLPSYAQREIRAEVPGPCRLKISDSSKSSAVSKAVVFLPLTDLDPWRVNVSRRQRSAAWDLWLHTTGGRRSIRFILYQGVPAEGGQDNKYLMTFPDREKAEAMAAGFRRAINICANATVPLPN